MSVAAMHETAALPVLLGGGMRASKEAVELEGVGGRLVRRAPPKALDLPEDEPKVSRATALRIRNTFLEEAASPSSAHDEERVVRTCPSKSIGCLAPSLEAHTTPVPSAANSPLGGLQTPNLTHTPWDSRTPCYWSTPQAQERSMTGVPALWSAIGHTTHAETMQEWRPKDCVAGTMRERPVELNPDAAEFVFMGTSRARAALSHQPQGSALWHQACYTEAGSRAVSIEAALDASASYPAHLSQHWMPAQLQPPAAAAAAYPMITRASDYDHIGVMLAADDEAPPPPPGPAPGTDELPSLGSRGHAAGRCKPCAFFHTKGCANDLKCDFCHLCEPGEKKRRQRAVLSRRNGGRRGQAAR